MQATKSSWVLLMRVGLAVGATSALALAFWGPRRTGPELSEIALLVGSMIGLLLFLTLDFARASSLRCKELSRARDELVSRGQQTAELQLSNKALGTEIKDRKDAEEALQQLSGRLLSLRDEEQHRLGRALREGTMQVMAALTINLERAQQLLPGGEDLKVRKLLLNCSELAEKATVELRTLSYLLEPPTLDDLGLDNALAWYTDRFSLQSGIQANLDVPRDSGRLPHEVELTVFRIVQESLSNVQRHSASATVDVTVARDAHRVTVQITDHGHGMLPGTLELVRNAKPIIGVGIAGMRERVRQLRGLLEIESDNNGTRIKATLPLVAVAPDAEHDNS